MTIKHLGGIFGRNPTFNDVTIDGKLTFDGDIDINSDLKVDGDIETTGNLIIGTSGNGIDFSATPGTGTSELLDDYEEGSWTPTLIGTTSGSATVTVTTAKYTKVGNMVNVRGYISVDLSSHNIVGVVEIGGIPFVANSQAGAGSVGYNLVVAGAIHLRPISSSIRLGKGDSNNWLHTQLLTGSNALMFFEATYETNS